MNPYLRRIIILVLTVLQLAVLIGIVGWRGVVWEERGWAGLMFQNAAPDDPTFEMLEKLGALSSQEQVIFVHPESPAAAAGIRFGDLVLEVGGMSPQELGGLRRLATRSQQGDAVTYRLERDGEPFETTLHLGSPLDSRQVLVSMGISLLIGLAFIAISSLVLWARPRSAKALVFYLTCTAAAAFFCLLALSDLDLRNQRGFLPLGTDVTQVVPFLLYLIVGLVLTNLILHLALIFPHRRPILKRWPQAVVWLHSLPLLPMVFPVVVIVLQIAWPETLVPSLAIIAALAVLAGLLVRRILRHRHRDGFVRSIAASPWATQALALVLGATLGWPASLATPAVLGLIIGLYGVLVALGYLCLFSGFSVLTCIALYRSYRESGLEERHQVRWPLWGTIVSLGSATLLSLIIVLWAHLDPLVLTEHALAVSVLGELTKICYLPIPLSFAFAILKYRLLDIDVLIRKTVIYGVLTGFVVALYFLLVGVVGVGLVAAIGIESQVVTVIATLLVAALFIPARRRVQAIVDRRFFRRQTDLATALRELRAKTLEAGDLDSLLAALAELLQRTLGARSVVILARASTEALVPRGTVGIPRERVRLAVDPRSPLLAVPGVWLDLQPTSGDTDAAAFRRLRLTTALVCRLKGQPVGILALGRKITGELEEAEKSFLTAAAEELSLAIGNLRQRREEVEFAQAFEIQRNLLPARIVQPEGFHLAAHWQPAREVSGDYYDILPLTDGRFALCIGDVSGKGMPAALLMSGLQAAVKAISAAGLPPREVCTRAREVVCQNLASGKFITFFYAVVDGASGRLTYTNAGHNPPVLVHRDGSVEELSTGGGVFARLFLDTPFQQGETTLRPGDRLVLYTDGVTEARNGQEEELGEERLVRLIVDSRQLDADGLQEKIVRAARDFTGGDLQDDLTMVVVAAT